MICQLPVVWASNGRAIKETRTRAMLNIFMKNLLLRMLLNFSPLKSVAGCYVANDVHDALRTVFDDHYVLPEYPAGITGIQHLQAAFDIAWERLKPLLQSGWQHAVPLS